MENTNISLLISFVLGLLCLGAYTYATRQQFYEVLLPKDGLSRLRWIILCSLLTAIFGLIPALVYQGLRLFGIDSELLRGIASITANISRLSSAGLLILIYTYRLNK